MKNLDEITFKLSENIGKEIVAEEVRYLFLKNKRPNGDGKNLKFFNQMPIAVLFTGEEGRKIIYSLGKEYDSAIKKIAKNLSYEYRRKNIKNEFDI